MVIYTHIKLLSICKKKHKHNTHVHVKVLSSYNQIPTYKEIKIENKQKMNANHKCFKFMDFHFQCLEPFLTPQDWLCLSRIDQYAYKKCNLKQTMFKKFKKIFLHFLNQENSNWIEIFWDFIKNFQCVIGGSSTLCAFTGNNYFNDIDVFHGTSENIEFVETHEKKTLLTGTTYSYAGPCIKKVEQFKSRITGKNIQYIQLSDELSEIKMGMDMRKKTTYDSRDFKNILNKSFDLDFCKIFFTFNCLEIMNVDSIIQKKSIYRIPWHNWNKKNEFIKWFTYMNMDKIFERIDKYKNRGFNIQNYEYLKNIYSCQRALKITKTFETETIERFNSVIKLEEKIKKTRKELNLLKNKLSSLENEEQKQTRLEYEHNKNWQDDVVNKWLNNDKLPIEYEEEEEDKLKIEHFMLNNDLIIEIKTPNMTIKEIFKLNNFSYGEIDFLHPIFNIGNITLECVYKVLCYANDTETLEKIFNPHLIPFKWIDFFVPYIKNYYDFVLPHVKFSSREFKKKCWQYIYYKWPHLNSNILSD